MHCPHTSGARVNRLVGELNQADNEERLVLPLDGWHSEELKDCYGDHIVRKTDTWLNKEDEFAVCWLRAGIERMTERSEELFASGKSWSILVLFQWYFSYSSKHWVCPLKMHSNTVPKLSYSLSLLPVIFCCGFISRPSIPPFIYQAHHCQDNTLFTELHVHCSSVFWYLLFVYFFLLILYIIFDLEFKITFPNAFVLLCH